MSDSTIMSKTKSIREPLDAGSRKNRKSSFHIWNNRVRLRCLALQSASLQIRERLFHFVPLVGGTKSAYIDGAAKTFKNRDRTQAEGGARWRQ
jgi:hypothetical protein